MFGLLSTKLVAVCAALSIACIGAWGGLQYLKLQKSKAAQAQAVLEKEEAISARDKAIGIAAVNAQTIADLQAEKASADAAVASLEAKRKKDAVTIGKLGDIIAGQRNNPANQVALSPVLEAVVHQIQIDRANRGEMP